VARMGVGRGAQRVLVGKPEGKSPLGRPRRRWEDNTKMDLPVRCQSSESYVSQVVDSAII
jgi:hypothetical protein